jgi:hypothetical protein
MNPNLVNRDIAGQPLNTGDHCLVTHNNRIILARVITVRDTTATVEPVNSDAGGRRSTPPLKTLRRNTYNLYRIPSQEITMSILRGAI